MTKHNLAWYFFLWTIYPQYFSPILFQWIAERVSINGNMTSMYLINVYEMGFYGNFSQMANPPLPLARMLAWFYQVFFPCQLGSAVGIGLWDWYHFQNKNFHVGIISYTNSTSNTLFQLCSRIACPRAWNYHTGCICLIFPLSVIVALYKVKSSLPQWQCRLKTNFTGG